MIKNYRIFLVFAYDLVFQERTGPNIYALQIDKTQLVKFTKYLIAKILMHKVI